MIKFFRKIRQKLLTENKFSKYLLYAIGEIVLVVIGILIALQINNWNEQKKIKQNAKEALIALKNDLVQDTILISNRLPEVNYQYEINESFRERVASPKAKVDTLLRIAQKEFNPTWNNPIVYNTNAYTSLVQTGLIEKLSDSLKEKIKTFYNTKSNFNEIIKNVTVDYSNKVSNYVDSYTFGATPLHDQGPLIDSLVWSKVEMAHLAASFQGLSNFKRILFKLVNEEMQYSQKNSKKLIHDIEQFLNKQ
ncbi:DUF6090 family protein [Sabulilitoribacter multivorans]|uniref:DUF6090 family protein n=1 Tax=Flaviramulus multivorans TaxID=1304750 RepID=A0ABS9IK14_9FLAO|nr:DUF6090 family protein [Flaviramulus multivorans]MCF7560921.1 DUF6090 family protein [Flaviramulus multivorans]